VLNEKNSDANAEKPWARPLEASRAIPVNHTEEKGKMEEGG